MVKAENSEKAAQKATAEARERNNAPLLTGLAKHVTEAWEQARQAKQQVKPRLKRAHRALVGIYDPEKLDSIEDFGGSTEYARITANKIRIVEAWLRDVFIGQADRPWSLSPTPKPSFPPDAEKQVRELVSQQVARAYAQTGKMPDPTIVRSQLSAEMDRFEKELVDEARKTTSRMEKKMADQLVEAKFNNVLGRLLIDLATYPTAILKGPVMRRSKKLSWKASDESGSLKPEVTDQIHPEFERVDPFRAYPAPGAESPQEGYFIEHHTYSESEFYGLIGSPGFDEEAIRAVIREAEYGGLVDWVGLNASDRETTDEIPDRLQRKVFNIDVLEYHGPVRGKHLIEWGIDDARIDDREATYEACVWLVGTWVIKAQINYDPLGQRPYYSTSYEHVPGEFWGHGLPDILDDVQGVANAAMRSLVNNMAMASGPQVSVNIDRLAPGQDVSQVIPWAVHQVQDSMNGTAGPAIDFFQPNSNVTELLTVIEKFYQFADDFSLVPRYMAGSDKVAGAGRTASGLSMLMEAANKGLKGVVSNVDSEILSPMLQKLYNHNMMYDEDPTIKGDAQVVARGAVSLMRLESLQLRRNEFLNITANPFDMQIVRPEGRAEVLRAVAKGLELNTNDIVPPEEEITASIQQQQQQQAQMAAIQKGTAGGAPAASRETLQDGSATTDNFSPSSMTS
jgi:hypothetical protein